jgi:cyclopropane fatty-acyl-phospholipid synthase-like methyltransferase
MFDLLKHCIPNDHSNQVTSEYFVKKISLDNSHLMDVLDLGCGKGESMKLFFKYNPKVVVIK